AGRVECHGKIASSSTQCDHATGLCGPHHSAHVLLTEHTLDRHGIRLIVIQPLLDTGRDPQQSSSDLRVTGRAHYIHCHTSHSPIGAGLDNPQPTPGEPRIDAEHAQRNPPSSGEQSFDTKVTASAA